MMYESKVIMIGLVIYTIIILFKSIVYGLSSKNNEKWISIPMFDDQEKNALEEIEIRIGYITGSSRKFGDLEYSRPGLTISGALTYALNDLKEIKFFSQDTLENEITNLSASGLRGKSPGLRDFGIRVKVMVSETFGDEEESLRQVAALWKEKNVSVILGPQETCLHEAKLATALNIPMISYFCSDEETSDKKHFATFSRTRPPDAAISRAIGSLILKFGWTKSVVLIYSDSKDDPRFKRGAKSLSILFKEKGVSVSQTIPYRGPYHHGYGENPFQHIVTQTKDTTRIYIIISEYYEHLGLVLALKNQKLLDNGEYLVIGVAMNDYEEDEWNPRRYFRGLLLDEADEDTPSAFRSYLVIIASPPKNYAEFSRQVNRHMELPPFDWPNPIARVGGIKKIRIEAAFLYDAVFLYANAVRQTIIETLTESSSTFRTKRAIAELIQHRIQDGFTISQKLHNRSFKSATGHESEMDENGDAVGNFTLVTLKQRDGAYGLYPIGHFAQHAELPELALQESIDWIGGSPPVSEPLCGFFGENCQSDNLPIVALGVFLCVLLFLGSASYLVFRHWRLSRDIDTLMWRIDKRDIGWDTNHFPTTHKPMTRTGSQTSLARFSSIFSPLVTYRGRIFAAKKLDMDLLVLDAPLKLQLKLLREIRHENLNAFIGACQLDDGLILVSDYCSRGSIKDILENCDLKLDDMFVSSLVGDLLRGLSYLHETSSFRFHGNLKPTNCLIDSRWVLKLSDFGLTRGTLSSKKSFDTIYDTRLPRHGPGRLSLNNPSHNATLLQPISQSPYLPPEFPKLSNGEMKSLTEGYRKGDIYSLGVILWELLKRESLGSYLRVKEESQIQGEIYAKGIGSFWSNALSSLLNEPEGTGNKIGPQNVNLSASVPSSPHGLKMVQSLSQGNYTPGVQRLTGSTTNLIISGSNNIILNPNPPGPSVVGNRNNMKNISNTFPKPHLSVHVLSKGSQGQNSSSLLISSQVIDCLESCLQFESDLRPDLKTVRTRLRPLHKGMRSNIFDTMIALMEKYANNLEKLVDERTKQLSEEKRKTDSLLYELIPASVAEELKEGLQVPAQSYDSVSIYFSDIVSFTSIAAESAPIQVVEFLNDLYTCFDSVIENFDVYKVEASGLPVAQEGSIHALEMARMALKLLQIVSNFKIRHRPEEILNLRIGLHSGPVCAGVVGQKRPRYCLFGDTVNTASRMESTGLSRRIHCSESFVRLVQENFDCERRGVVDVKGKGDMTTYWLIGEKNNSSRNSWSSSLTNDHILQI